jgi:two-component system sensor histidine kinase TctE
MDHLAATHEVVEFSFDWRRPLEDEAARLADAVDAELDRRSASGQPVRIAAMSVPLESLSAGQVDGHALVQVGETLVERREMARDVLIATLLPQLALMLLMTGIVYVGIGRGVAPLEALRREIENRSVRDLTPVKEDRAPPEVRRLVRSLNALLGRMSTTLAAQQRFIADAAHQLRTPTAALKTQVELAQRATDPAETRQWLVRALEAAGQNPPAAHAPVIDAW